MSHNTNKYLVEKLEMVNFSYFSLSLSRYDTRHEEDYSIISTDTILSTSVTLSQMCLLMNLSTDFEVECNLQSISMPRKRSMLSSNSSSHRSSKYHIIYLMPIPCTLATKTCCPAFLSRDSGFT